MPPDLLYHPMVILVPLEELLDIFARAITPLNLHKLHSVQKFVVLLYTIEHLEQEFVEDSCHMLG